MKLGAQLYTLRAYLQTEDDIRRSLKQVADMGYETVQVSGIPQMDASLLKSLCDEAGLPIVLTHNSAERILNDTDRLIEEHKIYGCKYIGLGGMPEKYRQAHWLKYFAEDYREAARKIKDAGMKFMYHNHHFEFNKVNGRPMMLDLLDGFEPDLMGVTVDTYWLQAAGCDVLEWLDILKDRIQCVHLKDMQVIGNDVKFAAIGEGNMNFPAILKKLEELGTTEHILVEQDTTVGSPFAALQMSRDYLKTLGY